MADEDNAGNLTDGLEGEASGGKKGGAKGVFPQLLKLILIGVAAIIFIITIVVITVKILNGGGNKQTAIPVSEELDASLMTGTHLLIRSEHLQAIQCLQA